VRAGSRLALWGTLVGILSALAYSGRAAGGKPPKDVLYQYGTAVSSLVGYAVILVAVLAIAGGKRELLALRPPRSWRKALVLGLVLLVAVLVAGSLLDRFLHAGREQGLTPTGWDPSRALQYAANFAVVAGVAPFVEELTFRGVGYTLLRARFGVEPAIVGSALCFGLAHGLVEALPLLVAFGIGLAWLRERQDSAFFPSMREYAVHYGLRPKHLERAAPDAIVMHPGPINRGIEIASEIADGSSSLILDQVTNGVAVRMAVLYLLAGGSRAEVDVDKMGSTKEQAGKRKDNRG